MTRRPNSWFSADPAVVADAYAALAAADREFKLRRLLVGVVQRCLVRFAKDDGHCADAVGSRLEMRFQYVRHGYPPVRKHPEPRVGAGVSSVDLPPQLNGHGVSLVVSGPGGARKPVKGL